MKIDTYISVEVTISALIHLHILHVVVDVTVHPLERATTPSAVLLHFSVVSSVLFLFLKSPSSLCFAALALTEDDTAPHNFLWYCNFWAVSISLQKTGDKYSKKFAYMMIEGLDCLLMCI